MHYVWCNQTSFIYQNYQNKFYISSIECNPFFHLSLAQHASIKQGHRICTTIGKHIEWDRGIYLSIRNIKFVLIVLVNKRCLIVPYIVHFICCIFKRKNSKAPSGKLRDHCSSLSSISSNASACKPSIKTLILFSGDNPDFFSLDSKKY